MPAFRRVLIVEDDAMLRATLAEQISFGSEFLADTAECAAEAELRLAVSPPFDLLILDVGLPDADGRDFCARLRREGRTMPIIMLTGADAEADVIRGLNAGANDYIAKPFRLAELMARMRAQLRVFDNTDDAVFIIGGYRFRPAARLMVAAEGGRKVRLTDKETAILKFLYRAGGRSVSRQTLLREVWGYNVAVATHTLETHVYRLRQKIERDPSDCRILVTESGGYRLDPYALTAMPAREAARQAA
ncbi:response regulator transcription factor [Belnapia sp. T6]|uniref:Response regulator transcription factor n=1 Tax=Belnapia mucosa TaxID=2804532 RepID=A0ABS1V1Z6_9PROT|nr:response regulator transcription factor [Belnapia mucosa]MBL6455698.1 response regulator transcription factor [Belnapia mucosa]